MNRGLKGLEEKVLSKEISALPAVPVSLSAPIFVLGREGWSSFTIAVLMKAVALPIAPEQKLTWTESTGKNYGQKYEKIEMGPVRKILMARARDPIWRKKAQSGGVVSALIDYALKKKAIDAAILTPRDTDFLPKGRIVRNREDILNCAGSSYVSGPTLEALHKGPWQEEEKIGVVGLPCHALALAKMRTAPVEKKGSIDKVNLVIGLFCTWALEYEKLMVFLKKRVGEGCIEKMDITPPPERLFKIKMADGLHNLPVDEIRPFIRNGCRVCFDMTAEFSDISVGTVEGIEGWNTVILRSDTGEDLFKKAEGEGIIESKPLPADHLNILKKHLSSRKNERLTPSGREKQQKG